MTQKTEAYTRVLDIEGSILEGLKDPEFAKEWLAAQDAELTALRKLLQEAGEVIEPFIRWKDQMENHPHVLSTKCTFDDDDIPFTVTPEWKDLRRAKAFSEKIKGVLQSSKEDAQ